MQLAVKNRYLNLSAVLKFATTQNEPNEPKRSNATHNQHSQTIFPYHVHNFDNPFITGKAFIYLGISNMSFTF